MFQEKAPVSGTQTRSILSRYLTYLDRYGRAVRRQHGLLFPAFLHTRSLTGLRLFLFIYFFFSEMHNFWLPFSLLLSPLLPPFLEIIKFISEGVGRVGTGVRVREQACMCMPWHTCGGQWIKFRSCLFPSTVSSRDRPQECQSLWASAFTHRTIASGP